MGSRHTPVRFANPLYECALRLSERMLEDVIRQIREYSKTFSASLASVLGALEKGDIASHSETLTLQLTVPEGLLDEIRATLRAIAPGVEL
jgi:hypothetical protein